VGHSRGGAITLRTLDTLPDLGRAQEIKVAVVSGGVYASDLGLQTSAFKNMDNQQVIQCLMASYNMSEADVIALYRARSPDVPQNHDKIVTPIFIAQGTADTRVLPENAKRLAADLAKMGVKYKLKFYPGAGHNFEEPQLSEFLRDCQAWFQENS